MGPNEIEIDFNAIKVYLIKNGFPLFGFNLRKAFAFAFPFAFAFAFTFAFTFAFPLAFALPLPLPFLLAFDMLKTYVCGLASS